MGFAITWMAVKDKDPARIHEILGVSETSERVKFPVSDINAARLPSEWYLIWFNRFAFRYVMHEVISELSAQCSVAVCVVDDHKMYSRSEYWENGVKSWHAVHDAQNGIYDLQISGSLPEYFERIKSDIYAKQLSEGGAIADVDYIFELPLELLKQQTCFKHDEEPLELHGVEYKVLLRNKTKPPVSDQAKPWWKIW